MVTEVWDKLCWWQDVADHLMILKKSPTKRKNIDFGIWPKLKFNFILSVLYDSSTGLQRSHFWLKFSRPASEDFEIKWIDWVEFDHSIWTKRKLVIESTNSKSNHITILKYVFKWSLISEMLLESDWHPVNGWTNWSLWYTTNWLKFLV